MGSSSRSCPTMAPSSQLQQTPRASLRAMLLELASNTATPALSATDQRQVERFCEPSTRRHRGAPSTISITSPTNCSSTSSTITTTGPIRPCRTNSQGLRRYQDHRDPISELVNIDSNDVVVSSGYPASVPGHHSTAARGFAVVVARMNADPGLVCAPDFGRLVQGCSLAMSSYSILCMTTFLRALRSSGRMRGEMFQH